MTKTMASTPELTPPFRDVPYLPQKLDVERRADGSVLLRNGQPLKPAPAHMLEPLLRWAATRPDQICLAQRNPVTPEADGWQTVSYRDFLDRVRSVAQGLLEMGCGPASPVMILSRNSIEHAVVTYAALWIGAPVCPLTPAYSLLSQDFARLSYAIDLIRPALVFAEDGDAFARAFEVVDSFGAKALVARNARDGEMVLSDLEAKTPGRDVDLAYDRLTGDSVAKYLLTSGSTGQPKGVINTHGMIAANAKMIRSVWDTARLDDPQIVVSFLPWSHTFGGNAILHNMLDWGGTLYIDWGAPTPDRAAEMFRNLKDVSPTQHTTVPAAWTMMATELERDRSLAEGFMKRLILMSYGGAAMGQDIYERIQAVAVDVTGQRISLSAGYGATETAPTTANVHWPNDTMGLIGLPIPGCEMKLAPVGEKFECRVKGPHITPGYYRDAEKTAAAFDEEGFYKLGDAVRFRDPDHPEIGLAFDGRIAEEFKLMNGTWVSAGQVRVGAVTAVNGALSDAVVCGLNETHVGLLGFLNSAFCERLVGSNSGDITSFCQHPAVVAAVREGLERYNAAHPNAAARIGAIVLQPDAPNPEAGEITDKGYINQARARDLRASDIERIYRSDDAETVIRL